MQERSSGNSVSTVDLSDHFPLHLLRSETVPPAPNQSGSAVDFLQDFAGYAWVGYGASSLLVISHFPSPLSPEETLTGPVFRQVFELSGDDSATVSAVSWSPVTPSKGEIAAASENCICVFSHDSASSHGSFCWSQSAVLVQSTKVEAIKWTGSGDGIVAGGIEVVLWKNKSGYWEVAWKFKTQLPQTLVSATWSIEGPLATSVASSNELHVEGTSSLIDSEASKCVLVCLVFGVRCSVLASVILGVLSWDREAWVFCVEEEKKMALNPQLCPNGMPVPFMNEMFVLARDGVEFEVDKIPGMHGGHLKAKGTVYLSNIRMVFVSNKPVGNCTAFDMPLLYVHGEKFNQPIFFCNNISGLVEPVVPENQHRALYSTHSFKILFKEGGCGTFVPLFFNLINSVRQYNQQSGLGVEPRLDPLQAAQTPVDEMMRHAYVDPNDPTRIFLQQPTPESQLRRRTYQPQPVEHTI